MTSPTRVNIDPTGNLLILSQIPDKVTPHYFRVSSKVLSLASPLFASLFQDHDSHSKCYQLVLDGDAPETLGTILELCHFGRTAPLPQVSLVVLYGLAVLSQKYAIAAPLIPWITIWTEPLFMHEKIDFSTSRDDLKKWLTIACVYNQGPLFKRITKQAILTGTSESLDASGDWEPPYSDILEKICPERVHTLSKLTAIVLTLLGRYQTMDTICKLPTNAKKCDAILLGSVLKGLMGLGVYQPIPAAPYPGMSVVDLVDKIEDFPFMWDSSHGEACREGVEEGLKEILKIVVEILDEVKGLDLKDFDIKSGVGHAKGMVITAVGDLDIEVQQTLQEAMQIEPGMQEQKELAVEIQVPVQAQVEEKDKLLVHESCDEGEVVDNGVGVEGQIKNDDLIDAVIETTSENESVISVMTELPAGVMEDFVETEDTRRDFGPRELFDGGNQAQQNLGRGEQEPAKVLTIPTLGKKTEFENKGSVAASKTATNKEKEDEEDEGGGEKEESDDQSSTVKGLSIMDMEDINARVEERKKKLKSDAEAATAKDIAFMDGLDMLINDQGQGECEKRPKKKLEKQKEVLGPIGKNSTPLPSVGRLDRTHPQPAIRKEVALLRTPAQHISARANAEAKGQFWEAPGMDLVKKYQRGPRTRFHPDVTVGDVCDPEHVSGVKKLHEMYSHVDPKTLFEFLRRSNWDPVQAAEVLKVGLMPKGSENKDPSTHFSTNDPIVRVVMPKGSENEDPTKKPSNDLTIKTTMSKGSENENPTKKPSSDDSIIKTAIRQEEKEVPKIPVHQQNISVPCLASGALNSEVADSDQGFWPPVDPAAILRAVKVPENALMIKKLLSMFPSARADKGFVDILYRAGWDLEKAAKQLGGLGLARKVKFDGGKPKVKGKAVGKEVEK